MANQEKGVKHAIPHEVADREKAMQQEALRRRIEVGHEVNRHTQQIADPAVASTAVLIFGAIVLAFLTAWIFVAWA